MRSRKLCSALRHQNQGPQLNGLAQLGEGSQHSSCLMLSGGSSSAQQPRRSRCRAVACRPASSWAWFLTHQHRWQAQGGCSGLREVWRLSSSQLQAGAQLMLVWDPSQRQVACLLRSGSQMLWVMMPAGLAWLVLSSSQMLLMRVAGVLVWQQQEHARHLMPEAARMLHHFWAVRGHSSAMELAVGLPVTALRLRLRQSRQRSAGRQVTWCSQALAQARTVQHPVATEVLPQHRLRLCRIYRLLVS